MSGAHFSVCPQRHRVSPGGRKVSLWSCRAPQVLHHVHHIYHQCIVLGCWKRPPVPPPLPRSPWPGPRKVPPSPHPPSHLSTSRGSSTDPSRGPRSPRCPSGPCQLSLSPAQAHEPHPIPVCPRKTFFSPLPGAEPSPERLQEQPRPAKLCWGCAHGIVLMEPLSFYLSSSLHPWSHFWAGFGATFTVTFTYMCCRPFCGTKFQPRLSF